MSLFPNSESNADAWADTHHTVLSFHPDNRQSLLDHLQAGSPDPLDMLLAGHETAKGAMLNEVTVEPLPLLADEQPVSPMPPAPQSLMMERQMRLSQCKLWEMLINYYASQGINAWQNSVPNFITSSVYMAESYAEAIVGFLTDYLEHLDLNEPVYIVEMATGTGRFSFHLLRELERKLACFSRFQHLKLRYIMTDFTESNPNFWQAHGRLAPYMECEQLDFAVFNPLVDQSMELRLSGQRLDAETLKNPVIAIANYFFDSTPVDVFNIQDQKVQEGLVSLERNLDSGVDPDSYPHISQITTHFEFRDLAHHHYYEDYDLNAVLNCYRQHIPEGQILFPLGAFDVVRNLRRMTNDKFVLLSSDKAYTNPGQMIKVRKHEFAVHDGTFSFMVNYDALGQYFHNMGGKYFATTIHNLSVQTVCLVSMQDDWDYEHLRYVFCEKINRQNPANSLCTMLPGREPKEDNPHKLNYYLAQIRMHMADPFIFNELAKHLTVASGNIAWAGQRLELLRLMDIAMNNYYYYPGECNLPFLVAPVYFLLDRPDQSLFCLQISVHIFGESPLQDFLMGQCFDKMEQLTEAMAFYQKALQGQPDFPEAQRALADVQARLNGETKTA